MYLNARKYVGDWSHAKTAERTLYRQIASAYGLNGWRCKGSPHLYADVSVAYWRKANQIHSWFVRNCQDGKDECQRSYVSRAQLEELRELCQKAISNKDASLLEPQEGFFFGATDIDDYYWQDLADTVKQLDRILSNETFKDWEFEYHSSW